MGCEPHPGAYPYLIGLTGGIGSGKSAVAAFFTDLGVPVIDADEVAKELVEPGQPALAVIRELFGGRFLLPDGRLDRRALRAHIFADAVARAQLDALIHPLVKEEMHRRARGLNAPYCLLSVPLLFEAGHDDLVARVVVVSAPAAERVPRIVARDGVSEEEAWRAIAAQMDDEERMARGDDLLINDGDLEALRRRVEALHRRYQTLVRGNLQGGGSGGE